MKINWYLGAGDFVTLLRNAGADVRYKQPITGWTALHFAAKNGQSIIFFYLLVKNNQMNVNNNEYIFCWMYLGHDDVVDLLIKNSDIINSQDKNGWVWNFLFSFCCFENLELGPDSGLRKIIII